MRTGEVGHSGTGRDAVDPAGAGAGLRAAPDGRPARPGYWRLVGAPPPTRAERLGRLVGLRVLRIPGTRRILVVAGSMDRLRDLSTLPVSLAPTSSASIVLAYWRAPRLGWSGGIGPLAHLRGHRVALPGRGRGVATVTVRLSRPAQLRDVLAAVLRVLGPSRPLPVPAGPNLTGQDILPAYLPTQPAASVARGVLRDSPEIRAHDVVLRAVGTSGSASGAAAYAVGWETGRHGPCLADGPAVLVDACRINPRGRRAGCYRPDAPRVRLEFGPAPGWRRGGARTGQQPLDGPGVTAGVLAMLRQVGVVDCPDVPDTGPVEVAALLVQLAMTGALVSAPSLPDRVADLIVPELRTLLASAVTETEPLAREARSVRQRRAALRGHATAFALPGLTSGVFPQLPVFPSVSVLLTTRRPERLPAALRMITEQTYPELEIVLCLHGVELPEPVRATLARCGRPYEIVQVPGAASFGEALGAATGRARGSLVTKFDDDDSYATEHVWDLVLARHYSGATLVGKGSEFVYLETLGITIRRPSGAAETDGEVVAGGTMLIAKGDLESAGGWRPVPRSVDFGLLDRVRRDGGMIYRTHPLGYVYHRRAAGHTWDPGQPYFLDSAYARWTGLPAEILGDIAP
ncbi:glycosyltransferase [Plantactinospora sp. S1510]|uniref:Glycosyltransferase n=1 Tax=Plantactinospora alkalitolerans TaxID=2789879 RepID=A0ABS0H0F6_9ACTN|nr:glycosyltransferase [Plantactinospora alkalitolerans]MBF9131946.1 glycosyltransferase [Plantactinospora alkalitolerans]